MIYEMLSNIPLDKNLTDGFFPFPAYKDREKWNAVSEDARSYYIEKGNSLKNKQWDSLPASYYLDYARNGNRSRYEKLCFQRRNDLFSLVIAECLEGKKEFLDDIINAVWLICEESTWVVPAHNAANLKTGKRNELVDIEEPVNIDLFSAETGSLLSWVYYFLGDLIAEESPLVKRRIEIEIDKRILKPYLERDDFGWMGLDHDKPVNNWNPWINSNILITYLVFANDRDIKIKGIEKTIKSIDRFLAFYSEDGGCDEGPGYFRVAGASLLDFLEELSEATNGTVDLYGNEMIRNMARYIYRAYAGKSYYVNFADAHARVFAPAGLLYRTGKKIGDSNLSGFAMYLMENGYVDKQYINTNWTLFRVISDIFQEYSSEHKFTAPKAYWFDSIQVLTARDEEGQLDGMFIAAKGGHNAESHNHNDIGNFVLYFNNDPVIVDAGVETYSKKTFSMERYTIWTMQSCYHNTPTINGFDQLPGYERKASSVEYSQDGSSSVLSMDIKDAYSEDAAIKYYKRKFTFKHGESFYISDSYSLEKCTKPLAVNLLAFNKPSIENGKVIFNESIFMDYDNSIFNANVEEIILTDPTLQSDWEKDTLYRIVLTQKEMLAEGDFVLKFEKVFHE